MKINDTKKKLLVHLGPPKTGTTSLQHWLQNNTSKDVFYLGIRPSRFDTVKNTGAISLLNYVKGRISLDIFLDEMERFSECDILLISEEMLVHGENWKCHLTAIAKLKPFFDIKIAYCYRDIKKVIPSYYAESHSNLTQKLKSSYVDYINSGLIDCYRLPVLASALSELNLSFNLFDFREFVKSQLNLNNIFGLNLDLSLFQKTIKLEPTNISTIKAGYYLAKVQTPEQLKFEEKIRRITKKFLRRDLSKYARRTYKLKITPPKELDNLVSENQLFWEKYKNE